MLEDKYESKYKICNESNPTYKIFNPQTEPFKTELESKLLSMFWC